MSIVNDALKKAAHAKDLDPDPDNFPQEQWILEAPAFGWGRFLTRSAGAAAALLILAGAWWFVQQLSQDPPAETPASGQIVIAHPTPAPASPKASAQDAAFISQHYAKGLAYYREDRYAEAEQEFKAILIQDPGQAVAQNNLGLIYHAQGKSQQAFSAYQEALKIDPNLPETMNNLGLLNEQQGRPDDAVSLYERALRIKPDYSEARLNYAILLERMGYLDRARSQYQIFLAQAPEHLDDITQAVRAHLRNLP